YCRNLGSATAAADSFCAEAILDTCSNTYTAADNNVASFPFDSICGVAYDDDRKKLCTDGSVPIETCANTIELVCLGREAVNEVMEVTANPFHSLCYNDDTYVTNRATFANKCDDEITAPLSGSTDVDCDIAKPFICAGTGEGDVANPFAKICEGTENLAELKRINCLATNEHSTCGEILGLESSNLVDSKVWQHRAVVNDNDTPDITSDDTKLTILTAPTVGDSTANFLLGAATATQLREDVLDADVLEDVNPIETLNLATGGGDDLGGLDTDGVFVFNATFDVDEGAGETLVNRLYAGLSNEVNLGGRLTTPAGDAPTTAVWIGRVVLQTFAGVADAAELYTSTDFALAIDFTNRTVDSTTEVSFNTNTATLVTSGKFNELGVIFGTTTLALAGENADSGLLTGLIGAKGALGAFHSGATAAPQAFAGGFVASAKICTDN
ncbi:MAG: hypothetical protein K8953_11500, partial [Proteobacteria bacterium]|nr:hypothetical protein [Pseudomonadota bacterium]